MLRLYGLPLGSIRDVVVPWAASTGGVSWQIVAALARQFEPCRLQGEDAGGNAATAGWPGMPATA